MKTKLLALALAAICMIGCSEDDKHRNLAVTSPSHVVHANGGTVYINIFSSKVNWTVETPQITGLTVTPTSGTGNEILTVEVPANTSSQKRQIIIRIVAGKWATEKSIINQAGIAD